MECMKHDIWCEDMGGEYEGYVCIAYMLSREG